MSDLHLRQISLGEVEKDFINWLFLKYAKLESKMNFLIRNAVLRNYMTEYFISNIHRTSIEYAATYTLDLNAVLRIT